MKKKKSPMRHFESQLTFNSALGTEMVDIKVGPTKTIFRIHKNLMCARDSKFYTYVVEEGGLLPEEELAIFGLFVNWLYTGELSSIVTETTQTTETEHLKLYSFVSKFELAALMDYIMTKYMVAHRDGYAYLETIEYIYAKLPACPFRRLMVHFLAYNITAHHRSDRRFPPYDRNAANLPEAEKKYSADVSQLLGQCEALGGDLVTFMMSQADNHGSLAQSIISNPLDSNPCLFHVHPDGSAKCKAKKK